MRVCISHTGEDGVIIEQSLEPGDIHPHREGQQQERKRDGEPAPGNVAAPPSGERAGTPGDQDKDNGDPAGNRSQRHQPAGDELPRGKSKKIKIQRLAKDRVHNAASNARRVPIQGKCRPLRHHRSPGYCGNDQRNHEPHNAQDKLDRQFHRLSADENRLTALQLGGVRPLQDQERSVENQKCGRGKYRECRPLNAQLFPEHVSVAERPEPERVHIVRRKYPRAENNYSNDGENDEEEADTPWRTWARPINGLRHCSLTQLSLTLPAICMILPPCRGRILGFPGLALANLSRLPRLAVGLAVDCQLLPSLAAKAC